MTIAPALIAAMPSVHQLDHFPLILLSALMVPLIIFAHGLLLARVLRRQLRPTRLFWSQ